MKSLTIIGGGPAALMLSAHIDTKKYKVTVIEKKKAVGRKFLVAGEGGLNLTFNSSIEDFIAKYHPKGFIDVTIHQFTNQNFINWLHQLNIPTFIGSSNRVFPNFDLKPIEVLNKIISYLKTKNITFLLNTQWTGWNDKNILTFKDIKDINSDIVVFALGGASWKVTGSDGSWKNTFDQQGIKTHNFRAANCSFKVKWQQQFIETHEGTPLKNIRLTYNNCTTKGELVVSKFGLEGNAIYALSQKIQDTLLTQKDAIIYIDLKPSLTIEQLKSKYNNSKKTKPTDILKRDIKISKTAIDLLKQCTSKTTFSNPNLLIEAIKSVPITITSAGPLDEAISSLGGIDLNEIDENFQLKKQPNTYVIGEMLDWYAPTGGYLLQGCFSMGYALAQHLNKLDI